MSRREDYYTFNEYMKNNKLTPSEEDYIEMIYRLNLENDKVQVKDISNKLNIKPPSVTKMIKKLNDKNMLIYKKYDSIELTSLGESVGEKLLSRHNTIKEFLTILGIKESIHEETETIEHTINVETLMKIEELINFFRNNEDVLSRLKSYQEENKN
ncbi:metal-dependent transcriptional regulator [Terrisporobacter glycolicus]|uniref:Manganese transport regulator n=1 Tax=Terrisporobacter glycolicus ATCC 14880 = DSM 1288 TaxID=1121315 RepID=A0ABZ2ETJ5_9FIRM|nr:iron dependent repressor, metal binding and dimerization domain protein [Terrisporobacter glycolicus]